MRLTNIFFVFVLSLMLACKVDAKKNTSPKIATNDSVEVQDVRRPVIDSMDEVIEEIMDEIVHEEKANKMQVLDEVPKPSVTGDAKVVSEKESKPVTKPERAPIEVEMTPKPVLNATISMHAKFNQLLNKYVTIAGEVNYGGIIKEKDELDAYLSILQKNPPQSNWSRSKKLAYWINAYNAFTIKRIVDNYPLKSITDLDNGKTWDVKWIRIGDKTYSLNNIENDIIRPRFNEPRIHFAVNCAAKSCPPLLNKAYTESNLETLLESQTKKFVNNKSFNQVEADKVRISKIFEWYKEDFGDLIKYINRYSKIKANSNASVSYNEYNWTLNN